MACFIACHVVENFSPTSTAFMGKHGGIWWHKDYLRLYIKARFAQSACVLHQYTHNFCTEMHPIIFNPWRGNITMLFIPHGNCQQTGHELAALNGANSVRNLPYKMKFDGRNLHESLPLICGGFFLCHVNNPLGMVGLCTPPYRLCVHGFVHEALQSKSLVHNTEDSGS